MTIRALTYKSEYSKSRQLGLFETFSRASPATMIDRLGNLKVVPNDYPRFDFDPLSLACKGLLMEAESTNLLTNSELSNGLSDLRYYSADIAIGGMDGFQNAAVFPEGKSDSYAYKSFVPESGVRYCLSVFVRMDDGSAPALASINAPEVSDFSLIINGMGVGDVPAVSPMGGGLYRVAVTLVIDGDGSPMNAMGIARQPSNTGKGFRVTGYQLEKGSAFTSYIPTQASAVTRTSPSLTVTSNFQKILRSTEGVMFIAARTGDNRSVAKEALFSLLGDSDGDRLEIIRNYGNASPGAGKLMISLYTGGQSVYTEIWIGDTTVAAGQLIKLALAYNDKSGLEIALDGQKIDLSGIAALPYFTRLSIGNGVNMGSWGGTIETWGTLSRFLGADEIMGLTK